MCDFTKYRGSQIGTHTHGLQLTVPTSLSLQPDAGNVWHESYTYEGYIKEPEEDGGAIQTAENSRFLANPDDNSTGNVVFPTNLFPESIEGIWFTPSEEDALNYCAQPAPQDGDIYTPIILAPIATGVKDAGAYAQMMNWTGQRYLYRLLGDSTHFLNLHNKLDSFYTANTTRIIGKFDTIDRLLYRDALSQQNKLEFNELIGDMQVWMDSVQMIDNLLRAHPADSLFLFNRYEDLLTLLSGGMEDFISALEASEDSALIYLTLANDINTSLTTSSQHELVQRRMYNILIRERLADVNALTSQDWDLIEEYAFGCPFEDGLAVWQAQSLLSQVSDTIFPQPYCEEIEPRSTSKKATHVTHFEDIEIYPNPSRDGWYVNRITAFPVSYELFDLQGVLRYQGMLDPSVSYVQAYDLVSGMYLLRFSDTEGHSVVKSIALIK